MTEKHLTRSQSREIDHHAIDTLGIPGMVLMENAGRGIADVLIDENPSGSILIFCGHGNNGGDGLVIARHLAIAQIPSQLVVVADPAKLQGDAANNYRIARNCQLPMTHLPETSSSAEEICACLDPLRSGTAWLVDALLGTGARGEPRFPYNVIINWINQQAVRTLAVDLPSGLDCDSGSPSAATVRADITCTMVAPKIGFLNQSASPYLGTIKTIPIGIPSSV